MKKNLLFTLMAVFLAWFWFGGISMASDQLPCNADSATACIGESWYDTLENAIANANNGDVVYLLKDCTITEAIQINDKSLTIEWSWDSKKTIWFSEVADSWNSSTAYVFKIWINSASSDIDVKLKNLIIQKSFYWIKHGYSNSSNKTILTLHDVSFENLKYWAVDMQDELSELHKVWSVEIGDDDLFVNIDTYDWSKDYVIPDWYDYCYINLNKYTCFNNEESLLKMEADVIAKIWTKYFSNLANAIDASSEWDVVLLLKDYSLTDQLQIRKWDKVVIDLNWKKLNVAAGYSNSIYHSCPVMVNYWGSLILKSSVDWWSISTMVDSSNDGNVYWAVCVTRTSTNSEDWLAKLTIESWSYSWYYYWIVWNWSRHGTEININWWIIEWINWSAIYHPQDWALNIEWWDLIWEETAIELRAWKLTISWWTFTARAEPTSSEANWNWTTTRGAAIAIAQHDTKKEISVNIDWWVFSWISAVYQSNPQNNDTSSNDVWNVITVLKDWSFNWQVWNKDDTNNKLVIQWWNYKEINWVAYKTENLSNYIDDWKSANVVDDQWNVLYVIEKKNWNENVKSYLIKLQSVSNWNISSTPSDKAHSWDKVTLTATPNSNYNFSKWTVKSWDLEIKVENNQFTMPAANVTVSATFTAKPTTSWGGSSSGRGSSGWSSSSSSSSKITTTNNTWSNTTGANTTSNTEEINLGWEVTESTTSTSEETSTPDNGYSKEFNDAYTWAFKNGITTMSPIEKADMNAPLTRIAMAKMLSQYAINVLGRTPDTTKVVPAFPDVSAELDAAYNSWVTLAYQLGIMWINIDKFRPDDLVTRAEFGTALSRMLYATADWEKAYYETHLAKLMEEKIITVDTPDLQELRGYVMIMLMRSANK